MLSPLGYRTIATWTPARTLACSSVFLLHTRPRLHTSLQARFPPGANNLEFEWPRKTVRPVGSPSAVGLGQGGERFFLELEGRDPDNTKRK